MPPKNVKKRTAPGGYQEDSAVAKKPKKKEAEEQDDAPPQPKHSLDGYKLPKVPLFPIKRASGMEKPTGRFERPDDDDDDEVSGAVAGARASEDGPHDSDMPHVEAKIRGGNIGRTCLPRRDYLVGMEFTCLPPSLPAPPEGYDLGKFSEDWICMELRKHDEPLHVLSTEKDTEESPTSRDITSSDSYSFRKSCSMRSLVAFGDGKRCRYNFYSAEGRGYMEPSGPDIFCFKLVPRDDPTPYNTEINTLVHAHQEKSQVVPKLVACGNARIFVPLDPIGVPKKRVIVTDLVGYRFLGEACEFEVLEKCDSKAWQDQPSIQCRRDWLEIQRTPAGLWRVWNEMLKSLKELHRCNIVHGDVKPQHFLIDPKDGSLKLIDFGASEILTSITLKRNLKQKRATRHNTKAKKTSSSSEGVLQRVAFQYKDEDLEHDPKTYTEAFLSARRRICDPLPRSIPSDDIASAFLSLVYWVNVDAPYRSNERFLLSKPLPRTGPPNLKDSFVWDPTDLDGAELSSILSSYFFNEFEKGLLVPRCAYPYLRDIASSIRRELSETGHCSLLD